MLLVYCCYIDGSLAGRSRSSFLYSVGRVSQLVVVPVLQAMDAASSVELLAQLLIGLDKSVELLGQVTVLSLQHVGMLGEGVLLAAEVRLLPSVHVILLALAVNITSSRE